MKICTIATKNFLSLRDCTISLLSPNLNLFVGSNGSGKTSLFRALRELTEAFEAVGTGSRKVFSHLYNIQAKPRQIDIDVEVSWDTKEEREAINAFLFASLIYTQPGFLTEGFRTLPKPWNIPDYEITSEKLDFFANWLREQFPPERLQFLYNGHLHLTYREDTGQRLSYTFTCKNEPITILMGSNGFEDGTYWRGSVPALPITGKPGKNILLEFLFSSTQGLEKDATEALVNTYFAYTEDKKAEELDIETFLLDLADKHGYLKLELPVSPPQAYWPEYLLLAEISGLNFTQANNSQLSFSRLFALLLRKAFVFTNSIFIPFLQPVVFDEKKVFPVRKMLTDEQDIPYWLLGLKNGNIPEKERYARIQQRFNDLTGKDLAKGGRTFDMAVDTVTQFTAQGRREEIVIDILVTDAMGPPISMTSQGSGIWETLVLSVFLEAGAGSVILLDEPATSLHPNMQHRLIEVLHTATGQVFVVTHSGHLLPTRADRLKHVYRFQRRQGETQVFAGGVALQAELQKTENKLSSSLDVGNLLFANGVLLVEGATEVGAFPIWFPKAGDNAGKTLADLNIALYGVEGKGNFPFFLRYLMAYGVPCAVIGDGDALMPTVINKDGETQNNKSVLPLWKVLQKLCPTITIPQDTDPFVMYKQAAALAGFYTYDTDEPITFEGIPEVQAYLLSLEQSKKKADSVYEARVLAESISDVPPLVNTILSQVLAWFKDL
jgi:energy-coupling factor transporter ATP-binding protein EcfA2